MRTLLFLLRALLIALSPFAPALLLLRWTAKMTELVSIALAMAVIPASLTWLKLRLSTSSFEVFSKALASACAPASLIWFSPTLFLRNYIRSAPGALKLPVPSLWLLLPHLLSGSCLPSVFALHKCRCVSFTSFSNTPPRALAPRSPIRFWPVR